MNEPLFTLDRRGSDGPRRRFACPCERPVAADPAGAGQSAQDPVFGRPAPQAG